MATSTRHCPQPALLLQLAKEGARFPPQSLGAGSHCAAVRPCPTCCFAADGCPQVRLLQLDKEGAELRDENAGLHGRLAALEAMAAANTAAQVR